jgi:hypothetical protein
MSDSTVRLVWTLVGIAVLLLVTRGADNPVEDGLAYTLAGHARNTASLLFVPATLAARLAMVRMFV